MTASTDDVNSLFLNKARLFRKTERTRERRKEEGRKEVMSYI